MWYNGYLPPTVINAATRGVTGVPSDYTPYLAPINNTPGATNYGNNNVPVQLANGSTVALLRLESLDKPEKPSPYTILNSSVFESAIELVNGPTVETEN
jgi:hypothetical protein